MKNTWISSFKIDKKTARKKGQGSTGFLFYLGLPDENKLDSILNEHASAWQSEEVKKSTRDVHHFQGQVGPVWIVKEKKSTMTNASHGGVFQESSYSRARDLIGGLLSSIKAYGVETLEVEFCGVKSPQELGALVGLELASYNYRSFPKTEKLPEVIYSRVGSEAVSLIGEAANRGRAINIARHLVNMPPNNLHPTSYAKHVRELFKGMRGVRVDVWDAKKLAREGMGLHLAVGQGALNPPCLVHIQYRPSSSIKNKTSRTKSSRVKESQRPFAFVGKGITFDSGGLDIKPSSGMRLMKKDMGGSAALVGLAYWVASSGYSRACDFYLALAENAVDERSMHPSDVYRARNGMEVEIHNTDAEGRLVMADAIDVAVKQPKGKEPEFLIDVSTLTGAIKVALGNEIGGLFSNDDQLASDLMKAGHQAGDYAWRMPLYQKYSSNFSSPFADIVNATDSPGGGITAALFLEKFVGQTPWAHFDIYAWNDRSNGALSSTGGSGQSVQLLIEFLNSRR